MLRPMVLFMVICVAVTCSGDDKPAPPTPLLDLPDGRLKVTVEQRGSTRIPGSGGLLILRVGDVTGGRVDTSLIAPPLPTALPKTSMSPGDVARFTFGDEDFELTLVKLHNALVGDDFATFEITPYSGAEPRPQKPLSETEKIERLIVSIEHLENATFIRNGTAYTAIDAAAHIRSKLKYAGNRIKTAEQFIEHLATRSSQSGEPYLIRFQDGREVQSAEFLRQELKKLEDQP